MLAECRILPGSGARLHRLIPRLLVFISLPIVLPLSGCDKQPYGVVDPKAVSPFVSNALVSPDSIKLTTLPESNGLLIVNLNLMLRVARPEGLSGIGSVDVDLFATSGTDPILQTTLRDDGVVPDVAANDGVHSARIQFNVPKSTSGRFRVQFRAVATDGLVSNLIEKSLFMIRNNAPPSLSQLHAPDSIIVPVGGSALIKMTVNVSDPDGAQDIKQVYFLSLDSSDPTQKFFLKDDGAGDSGISGDILANDGVYTVKIQVSDSPTVRKTYRFLFQASDAFGDTSASILHRVTVK